MGTTQSEAKRACNWQSILVLHWINSCFFSHSCAAIPTVITGTCPVSAPQEMRGREDPILDSFTLAVHLPTILGSSISSADYSPKHLGSISSTSINQPHSYPAHFPVSTSYMENTSKPSNPCTGQFSQTESWGNPGKAKGIQDSWCHAVTKWSHFSLKALIHIRP